MNELGQHFRTWILSQRVGGAEPQRLDDQHFVIRAGDAVAEVNFYLGLDGVSEIVELLIMTDPDESPAFFLHFVLDDLQRAEELFCEMAQAFEGESSKKASKILLCCTSGMTTSFFAAKMADVARGLALPYEFSALSFEGAMRAQDDYAAILLAPQVGHLRRDMAVAHPNAVVFEVPGATYGSYDAAGAIKLLMHALREVNVPGDDIDDLRAMRSLSNDKRILVITLFFLNRDSRLGYRLYEHGEVTSYGVVRKARFDYRDVEDLIETVALSGVDLRDLDAIGIAVPGVAYHGTVSLPGIFEGEYDLAGHISERFGVQVHVDNNCNAATCGCYVLQKEHETLMFYRHEFGHPAGGLGTIIDGRLLKGWHNMAGEVRYFEHRFEYSPSYEDAVWRADGLFRIVQNVILSGVSIVSPEAVYVSADTVDDMEALRMALARELPEELIPELYYVGDYVERVYLGEMALCLQKIVDPNYRSHGVS